MFENIVGHEKNKKVLQKNILDENINHAYLFQGKEGIGKQLIAKEFAKRILETNKLETCPDYRIINKEEGKKDIVVEQIRKDIVSNVLSRPISSKKKVYIINDAHSMNTMAQNALLKTLEEPPEYVVIILISNQKNAFLPTIKSRVKTIEFKSLAKSDIKEYMQQNNITGISDAIVDYIDGSIAKINSLSKDDLTQYTNVINLMDRISTKPIFDVILFTKEIDFKNLDSLNYLQYALFNGYKKTNKICYVNCVEIVEKAKRKLKSNGNYDIVIDNMVMNLYKKIRR